MKGQIAGIRHCCNTLIICGGEAGTEAGGRGLWLIRALKLYLTDFLNRIFSPEIAQNSHFYGVEK
jgi:hypothetical protein